MRLHARTSTAHRRRTAQASLLALSTAIAVAGEARAQTTPAQGSTAQASRPAAPEAPETRSASSTLPQVAPDRTGAAPADASSSASEIIVTAQKRSERLQDVPISISVVNNAVLAATNSKNLGELSGAVPGIQFNGNGGGGRTYTQLRGTTGSALNIGDEPVAVYMDDVYVARGLFVGNQDLLDVGSIEIVRGPQGTLQGRNATAGAILMRSADPTATPQGFITASVEDPLEYRVQGAVSGPLGHGLQGRLSAGYVNADGYGHNSFNDTRVGGDESTQVRGVLTYNDGGRLTARIVADYSTITNVAALFRASDTTTSATPGALVKTATPLTPLNQTARDRIYDDDEFSLNPNTRTTVNTDGLSAKFNYALDGVDLVSVTGYRRAHVFGTNNSSGLSTAPKQGYNDNNDKSEETSQELRLQSSGKTRFSWITGIYYFNEAQDYDDTIYNTMFTTPTSTASRYFGTQDTTSYAAFADGTYNILDNLQLIAGVRDTEDTKHLVGGIRVTNLVTNGVTNTPYTPHAKTWAQTNYRVKLVYHPLSNVMTYVGYSTGYRSGGYNAFAVQAPFSPESIASFEAGAKGDFFDRRVSLSGAVYHNDYDNLQLRAGVPSGGAIVTNAATSEINGFEIEGSWRPFDRTHLSANMSYTDAKFTSFPRAVDLFNNFVDSRGLRLPNAPKTQFFFSAAQDFELPRSWLLTAEANYRWRDRIYYYFTNQVDALSDGPGGQFNARLQLKSPDDKWTVAAFVNNLFNDRNVTTDVITFSNPEVSLNKPRSVGVALERRF